LSAARAGSIGIGLVSLEHSRLGQQADLLAYGVAIAGLGTWALLRHGPGWGGATLAALLAGLCAWTLIEYAVHRFVLHHVPPFKRWHTEHHRRPRAAIGLPTVFSGALFAAFVFAPAWWLGGLLPARDLTLGVLAGYLGYALVHRGVHQPLGRRRWLAGHQRWHARHHAATAAPGVAYGVTSGLWDHVFGTAPPVACRRDPALCASEQ
jgi:sterol desaturase/sphingolipid hydroxylase (fatty acid hydroxylase superfamily)